MSRTPLAAQAALPAPPPPTMGMPEDRPDRNKCPTSPGSTFAARSVVQLPTLTRRLRMEVSCSIWGRSTEVRCCLQTVWDNCAGSIARPVSLSPVQLLRERHSSPRTSRWGHLPGQTTSPGIRDAAASGAATDPPTPSGLPASASRRTSGRQPAWELPHPGRRPD